MSELLTDATCSGSVMRGRGHCGAWWPARMIGFDAGRLSLAVGLLIAIVFARAPFTQVPDALFVSDGFGYYIYLPSLIIDGDLDLSNQLSRLPYEGEKRFFKVSEETGLHTNQFPVGSAILWSPFFLAADAAVLTLRSTGAAIPRNGFGFAYELPVYVGSFLYGLAAIWMIRLILRRLFSGGVADLSLFAVVFATPMAYYLWFEPNMSHGVAAFLVALWMYLLLRIDCDAGHHPGLWILLGLVLGLIALVRPYNAMLGLAAIPVALRVEFRRDPRSIAACIGRATIWLAITCLCSLAMLAPQIAVWRILYGEWFVVPKGSGYEQVRWSWAALTSFLASIFVLWPAYLIAGVGLVLAAVGGARIPRPWPWPSALATPPADSFPRAVAPFLLLVLVIISMLVAGSRDWMLGTAFGQRRMVDWTPFFALGLAVLLDRLRRFTGTRGLPAASAALAGVNALLVILYLAGNLPQYGRVF